MPSRTTSSRSLSSTLLFYLLTLCVRSATSFPINGAFLNNFTTLIDGEPTDVTHATYQVTYAAKVLSGITSLDTSPWRSHASVFQAQSAQPMITIQHVPSGGAAGWKVCNVTLIELCDKSMLWPPMSTCIYDPLSPERILNGDFQYYDTRYPSQISYWDTKTLGRSDNVLVLPAGGDQSVDNTNTAGVGMFGMQPSMSQTLYGLDATKEYEFGISISWSNYFIGSATSGCNMTAALDDSIFWRYDGRSGMSATWMRYSARVQPLASTQKLTIGAQCAADTRPILIEFSKVYAQYLRLDDVSFQEYIK